MPRPFPVDQLKTREGELLATIFENQRAGIDRALFHSLTIPLEPFYLGRAKPFSLGRTKVETEFSFEFLRLDTRRWQDLAGRTFHFTKAPEERSVDGSIYVDGVHNPVKVNVMTFGEPRDGLIPVRIDLDVDFESEGVDVLDFSAVIEANVRYGGVMIEPGIVAPVAGNEDLAKRVAAEWIDLDGHGEPDFSGYWLKIPYRGMA